MLRRCTVLGLLCLLLFCAGCVETTESKEVYTYRFQPWIPVTLILVSFIIFGVAAALRRKFGFWGWVVMAMSVGGGCVIGPSVLMDKAIVSNDDFSLSVGLWFDRNEFHLKFDDIVSMSLSEDQQANWRGRNRSTLNLVCNLKDGSIKKVPIGTLMQEGPLMRIMFLAAILEIPFKLN